MTIAERFAALILNPSHATSDLRGNPRFLEGFVFVFLYAVCANIGVAVDTYVKGNSIGLALIVYFGVFITTFLMWIFFSIIIHLCAKLLGGDAEYVDAIAYIGLAAAPMVITGFVGSAAQTAAAFTAEVEFKQFAEFLHRLFSVAGLLWGIPGVLCYYMLKHVELLDGWKAAILSSVLLVIILSITFGGTLLLPE